MADTLTTTSQIDPAVQTYYDRKLLVRGKPFLVHNRWAQQKDLPAKSGNQIKFRRYALLNTATTPLTEGITPSGQRLSKTDILASPSQYGDFVHETDVVELTVEDNTLNVASDDLAQQYAETLDELTKDVLASTLSVTNASSGSNGNTPTEMTTDDYQAVCKTLIGNKARMITSMIKAGTGQGTSPIRPSFRAIIHTDLIDDLESCTGFKAVTNYSNSQDTDETEWGNVKNVRFHMSQNADKTSGSPDTYKIPILGRNAYGTTKIKRGDVKWIYHDPSKAGGPLEQQWTAGWKTWFVARILNDNFMHALNVSHS